MIRISNLSIIHFDGFLELDFSFFSSFQKLYPKQSIAKQAFTFDDFLPITLNI